MIKNNQRAHDQNFFESRKCLSLSLPLSSKEARDLARRARQRRRPGLASAQRQRRRLRPGGAIAGRRAQQRWRLLGPAATRRGSRADSPDAQRISRRQEHIPSSIRPKLLIYINQSFAWPFDRRTRATRWFANLRDSLKAAAATYTHQIPAYTYAGLKQALCTAGSTAAACN